ncbi:protein expanded-like [Saccoglossus kowalevskii]
MGSYSRTLTGIRRFVNVVLPTQEETQVAVEVKGKCGDVFDQVVSLLGTQESQYFGLAIQQDGEFEFLDLKTKLSKYAPKGWKNDSGGYGADKSSKSVFTVYFKVQFYVEHPNLIVDDVTRYQYYLLLRDNVLECPLPCSEENYFLLAAYALQADHGNYINSIHTKKYFEPEKYFPKWVLERRGEDYILNNVPEMHKDQRGLSKTEAQVEFIKQATSCLEHVMHFYSVKKNKSDSMPYVLIGVCTKGLQIYYEDVGGTKYLKYEYHWNSIRKLHFVKKKFEIQAEGVPESRKLVFHCSNDSRAKSLLHLSRLTHTFQVHTQVLVDRLKKIDEANDKKKYRESYISGDLEWELDQMLLANQRTENERQRNSVISTGSSNTTSGIVSDDKPIFVKSLTEEDEEIEYMITGPPFVDPGGVDVEISHQLIQAYDYEQASRLSECFAGSDVGLAVNPLDKCEYDERYALSTVESSILADDTSDSVKIKQSMEQKNRHSQGYFSITGQSENTDSEWSTEEEVETMTEFPTSAEDKLESVPIPAAIITSAVETNDAASSSSALLITNGNTNETMKIKQEQVQEELKKLTKEKQSDVPLLKALCNDKTLLALAEKQDTCEPDGTLPRNLPETDSHTSSTSSTLKERNSRNASLNTIIVDSNSSVESDHCKTIDNYHGLNKHHTLPALSGTSRHDYDKNLQVDISLADGIMKCQTLPAKMNAGGGHVIPSGADPEDIYRDDVTSFSAPNLSPQPLVVSPGC